MSEIRFSPDSWAQGAQRVDASGQDFASAVAATLARCSDLGALGCNNGGTIADAALGMIMPVFHNAVNETLGGIAQGLATEAENMVITGRNYADAESTNAEIASMIGGQ